ncbi:hypothetical protein [Proteus terrae]|uniref:hypothetical protein n=1 Tax=Proteus terrae TaxID=1574161 RepID=UPI0028898C34|nr:hypothetical protein [Proteus terrae]
MKVEQSQVTKLVITDVERHDPIHVYLEDYGDNRRGRITISEFGKSWSCFWGGMGMSLTEFLLWITDQYWIGYLDSKMHRTIDADNDENIAFVKGEILRCRKRRVIDEFQSRTMFDDSENSEDIKYELVNTTPAGDYGCLFSGEAWLAQWPTQDNPEYIRMASRLNAVREALKQIKVE